MPGRIEKLSGLSRKYGVSIDMVDVEFDCVDYTRTNHPGPKSNKLYAEKIKDVLQNRFK